MKKTLLVALVALLVLAVASASADVPPGGPFAYVNFNSLDEQKVGANYASFNYVASYCFGGDPTGYAVAFLPGGDTTEPQYPLGYGDLLFNWVTGETPRRLELVVLDSGVNDSFYVQLLHPKTARWVTILSYTGDGSGWQTHKIYRFPGGAGKKIKQVTYRIVPTEVSYSGCGQIAVDYAALYTSRN
jgi:hypothetical protein